MRCPCCCCVEGFFFQKMDITIPKRQHKRIDWTLCITITPTPRWIDPSISVSHKRPSVANEFLSVPKLLIEPVNRFVTMDCCIINTDVHSGRFAYSSRYGMSCDTLARAMNRHRGKFLILPSSRTHSINNWIAPINGSERVASHSPILQCNQGFMWRLLSWLSTSPRPSPP